MSSVLDDLASVGKESTKSINQTLNSIDNAVNYLKQTNIANPNQTNFSSLPDPSTIQTQEQANAFNKALAIQQDIQADEDFGYIDRDAYIQKYGQQAYDQRITEANALLDKGGLDFHNPFQDYVTNPLIAVGQGIASGALGTAGVAGLLDPSGTINSAIGSVSESVNNFADSLKSDNVANNRLFDNAKADDEAKLHAYQEQVNIANGANPNDELVKRILKDAGSYITSRGTSSMIDDLAQGVGFVYPSSLAAKGLATAGKLAGKAISNTRKGARIGESIGGSTMLNSGIGYGGASANNVANQIDAMSADEVLATSPLAQESYKEYLEQGYSPEQAKEMAKADVRGKTSREAGLLAGAIAALPSAGLSQRYIRNPFTKATGKEALYSVAENTLQGNVTLGENIAKKENLNPDQDLGEGVGTNIGLGFTSSLSTAAGGGAKAYSRYSHNKANLKELDNNFKKEVKPSSDFIKSRIFEKDSKLTSEQKQEINNLKDSFIDNSINSKYGIKKNTDFLTGLNTLKRNALKASQSLDDNGRVLEAQTKLLDYYADYSRKIQDLKSDDNLANTKEGQEYGKALELIRKDKYIQNAQNELTQRINTLANEDLLDEADNKEKKAIKYAALYSPLNINKNVLDYAEKSLNLNNEEKIIIGENKASLDFIENLNNLTTENTSTKTKILNEFINNHLQTILNNRKEFSNSTEEQSGYINELLGKFQLTELKRLSSSLAANIFNSDKAVSDNKINPLVLEDSKKSVIKEPVLRDAITSGMKSEDLVSQLYRLKEITKYARDLSEISNYDNKDKDKFIALIDDLIKNPSDIKKQIGVLAGVSPAGAKLLSDLANPAQSNHNIDLKSFVTNSNLRTQLLPEYFNVIDQQQQAQTQQATQQTNQQTTEPVQETPEQAVEEEPKSMAQKVVNTAKNVASKTANTVNTVKKAVKKVMGKSTEETSSKEVTTSNTNTNIPETETTSVNETVTPEDNISGSKENIVEPTVSSKQQAEPTQETENTVSPESRTDKGSPVENNTSEPVNKLDDIINSIDPSKSKAHRLLKSNLNKLNDLNKESYKNTDDYVKAISEPIHRITTIFNKSKNLDNNLVEDITSEINNLIPSEYEIAFDVDGSELNDLVNENVITNSQHEFEFTQNSSKNENITDYRVTGVLRPAIYKNGKLIRNGKFVLSPENTQKAQKNVETKPQTEEPTQEQNTKQTKETEPEKKVVKESTRNLTQVEIPDAKESDLTDDTPLVKFTYTGEEEQYKTLGELNKAQERGEIISSITTENKYNPLTGQIEPTTIISYANKTEIESDPELFEKNGNELAEFDAEDQEDLATKEETVEKATINEKDREEINKVYSLIRSTPIVNAFGSKDAIKTGLGSRVMEELRKLGEFTGEEKIEDFQVKDSLSSLFNYKSADSLVNKFGTVLEGFIKELKNFPEEINKILDGTSTLPIALQMLVKPILNEEGEYELTINSNIVTRLSLALMDSAINNMELPSSEADTDIAKNVGVNIEDLNNAQRVLDKTGKLVAYSGREFLDKGSKNISLKNYQRYLSRKLQDFLGFRPNNDTDLKASEAFFKHMAIELIDLMNQKGLLFINKYNIGKDEYIERINFNRSLKNQIKASMRMDEDSIDNSDIYKAELPSTITQDFFLEKVYTDPFSSIGRIGEIKFLRPESIMPFTSIESQKWLDAINRVHYLMNPLLATTIEDDAGVAFWCAMSGASLSTKIQDKDYKRSINGKQLNIKLAIQRANEIISDMREYAAKNDIPLSEVAKYYDHRVISNGRAQEIEAFGPTVDKLIREILSSTKANVDLTGNSKQSKKQLQLYQCAIAQAFGTNLGVTKLDDVTASINSAITKLQDILNNPDYGDFHKIIEFIRALNNGKSFKEALGTSQIINKNADVDTDNLVSTTGLTPEAASILIKNLIRSLGEDFNYESPASFRALCSLVNYMDTANNNNPEKLKNMEVFDWIEIDGTNHGPSHTLTEYSLDYENVVPVLATVGMYVGTTDVNHASRAKMVEANKTLLEALEKDLYNTNLGYSGKNLRNIQEGINELHNNKSIFKIFLNRVVNKLTGKNIHNLEELTKEAKDNHYESADKSINSINYFLGVTASDPTAKYHLSFINGVLSLTRSWMKPWTMQGGYLSGLDGLTRGALHITNRGFSKLRNTILNNLKTYLDDINNTRKANNPNAQDIEVRNMLEGLVNNSLNDDDKRLFGKAIYNAINNITSGDYNKQNADVNYLDEFNKFIDNMDNLVNVKLDSIYLKNTDQNVDSKSNEYLYGIRSGNTKLGVNLLRYGWGYFKSAEGSKVYKTLFNNVKTYAMRPISKANDQLLRENSNLLTDEINDIASGVAAEYNRTILDKIQEMIQNDTFTLGNVRKLYKELKDINNVYTTEESFINFTLGSQNDIPLTNNKLDTQERTRKKRNNKFEVNADNTEGVHKYTSLSGREYTYDDTFSGSRMPGVAAVPISTQTNSDVSMSHDVVKDYLEANGVHLNATFCHDGIHTSLLDALQVSVLANKSALRTFLQNPAISFFNKQNSLINHLKNEDDYVAISTKNLFNRVNEAITKNDFSDLGDQELADYLNIIKQFIRHSGAANKSMTEFGIDYSLDGISSFINDLAFKKEYAKEDTVKEKYKKLYDVYSKLSKESTVTTGVLTPIVKKANIEQADYKKDGIETIFRNPRNIISDTRADPNNFPIKWAITFDDLLTLADDFSSNLGNQIDKIDCLHQAMKDFGIVAHHFAGNPTGVNLITSSEKVQNRVNELKAEYGLKDNPTSKEDFRKIGFVINQYANELYNNRNKALSRSSIKPKIIASNNIKTFIDVLTTGINNKNNLDVNVASEIPSYDLVKHILASKGINKNAIPRIVITESADTDVLIDKDRNITFPMASNQKGAYIYSPEYNNNFGYIVINKAAINDYCNLTKENPDTEIKRTIAHELIHGTVGESIGSVLNTWAERGSIEPHSQEEHLVSNLLSAVFVALKTVKVNSKDITDQKELKEFLTSNFGLAFGGNFLYSLLSNPINSENQTYLNTKDLLDKFNDDSYTRGRFIRDLINSEHGIEFADEALTFLANCSLNEFNNIEEQIATAIKKDKIISKTNAKFIEHSIKTLKNLGKKVVAMIKNLLLLHLRISPTKDNIADIQDGIENSFSNGVIANVSALANLKVRTGNVVTQTGTQIRNDSFINNDGTFNNKFEYSIPQYSADTPTTNVAEFLNKSYSELSRVYKLNAYKYVANALEIAKSINEQQDGYLHRLPKINEKIPSRFINTINKAITSHIANERANKVIDSYKDLVVNSGFLDTQDKRNMFDNIFRSIAMHGAQNNQNYNRLSQLREYILTHMSYEDFLEDKENASIQDVTEAQRKYDTLSGKLLQDNKEFSQALFYSLVCLDPDLQNKLIKMDIPNIYKTSKGDNILDKAIIGTLDSISEFTTKALASKKLVNKQNNLRDSVFTLLTAFNERYISEQFNLEATSIVGDSIQSVNNLMIDGIGRVFNYYNERYNIIKRSDGSKQPLNYFDSNFGSEIGENVTEFVNKHSNLAIVNDLIKDIVGSTQTTYPIYQIIKQAHAEVQQTRQMYREQIPASIIEKFKKRYKAKEYARLTDCVEAIDLSCLNDLGYDVMKSLVTSKSPQILNNHIQSNENLLKAKMSQAEFNRIKRDALNLAHYMASSNKEYSFGFKYNPYAILVDTIGIKRLEAEPKLENTLDQLISLYALNEFKNDSSRTKEYKFLSRMLENEKEGMNQVLSTINAQYKAQNSSIKETRVRTNAVKGYLGNDSRDSTHIVIESNKPEVRAELERRGYTYLKDYPTGNKGYYLSNLPNRSMFIQGGIQDIHYCVNGVNAVGNRINTTAERIYDPKEVRKLLGGEYLNSSKTKYATERLVPVYDVDSKSGRLKIIGFERTVDANTMKKARPQKHIAILAGITAGRMKEREASENMNKQLIQRTYDMWHNARDKSQYINLFNYYTTDRTPEGYRKTKDAVIADALSNIPVDLLNQINEIFNSDENRKYLLNNIDDIFPDRDRSISPEEWLATHKVFMVRKDMIKDIIGIRHPSISDAWTGVSRWSPKTQERIRNLAESIFGYNRAYKYLYNAELGTMKAVAFARNTIVIKSLSVAVDNMVANFYDLMLRGVPLTDIVRSIPDIYTQLDMYTRDKNELIRIEAQRVATAKDDTATLEKLRIRENIINDRIKKLNIAPLLEAGEFSTIADVGLTDEEVLFTSGRFTEAFNNALNSDRVPKMLSVPVKYFLVTKDTALYRTLEKSVSYGDFIGKAIYYKHLTQNKGMDETEAMRRVSDEFVNYDRLAGRNRIYLENMGLLWFYNFKLRMVKVHLDLLRNDPARILLNAINPLVLPTPMADSFLGKMFSGKLGYTIGPEMGLNSWRLLPFLQLFGHL